MYMPMQRSAGLPNITLNAVQKRGTRRTIMARLLRIGYVLSSGVKQGCAQNLLILGWWRRRVPYSIA
jgi:hypothetical protein